ncbi:unnamed protein product [Echinostoma caproni]|uniref:YTH domain-containing protein n=1 Tax=Echinostoma caproni TaxID=27848 RepID=A0A183ANP9_9TREM|nr:unnamed protein product [Echinostoma caproni]
MTNAADTYYGTLFSHLSYGMGENGAGANSTPNATYTDAAMAAAAAAAAMAAATGVGDWTNVSSYQQGSGVLPNLNPPIPTVNMTVGPGVTNSAELSIPSGAASTTSSSNITSPYCATLLAAVAAAAAAAAYPVHPTQSGNVSAGSSTPAADYAALYYRSSGQRPPVVSSAANPYNSAVYPTASWPYSVSPNHYPNSSQVVDRINPNLVPVDGWSASNGQPAVIPSIGSELGINCRQHTPHIPSTMFSSTVPCDRASAVQNDLIGQPYFTSPSNRKPISSIPVSQSLTTTGNEHSGLYSMLPDEVCEEAYLAPDSHQLVNDNTANNVIQTVYKHVEPFSQHMCQHTTEHQQQQQQQQTRQQPQQKILDEFNRLSLESNRDYKPPTPCGPTPSTESVGESVPQAANSSQWQYHEVNTEHEVFLSVSDNVPNREQGTRTISGILRPLSSTSQPQFTNTMSFPVQPAKGTTQTKTWANIAGQPPKGSAAVLMSSTGWSIKRTPGHVLTQGSRGSITTPSTSVIVAKPQTSHSKPDDHAKVTQAPFRSGRPESSVNSENERNTASVTTNGKGGSTYEDSLQLLQREAELLHQRLAKSINPAKFDTNIEKARFFVIKSFSEDDIHRSIKYSVWCSTELGNKKLDAAFVEAKGQYPIYLFYSVNGSGHFCGMAEMTSRVDYDTRMRVWAQDKWQGAFSVRWIFVKDVPNTALRHIRIETNENKPVTHSRDTTELPLERGRQVMEVFAGYSHTLSIFDDFVFYEQRERQDVGGLIQYLIRQSVGDAVVNTISPQHIWILFEMVQGSSKTRQVHFP